MPHTNNNNTTKKFNVARSSESSAVFLLSDLSFQGSIFSIDFETAAILYNKYLETREESFEKYLSRLTVEELEEASLMVKVYADTISNVESEKTSKPAKQNETGYVTGDAPMDFKKTTETIMSNPNREFTMPSKLQIFKLVVNNYNNKPNDPAALGFLQTMTIDRVFLNGVSPVEFEQTRVDTSPNLPTYATLLESDKYKYIAFNKETNMIHYIPCGVDTNISRLAKMSNEQLIAFNGFVAKNIEERKANKAKAVQESKDEHVSNFIVEESTRPGYMLKLTCIDGGIAELHNFDVVQLQSAFFDKNKDATSLEGFSEYLENLDWGEIIYVTTLKNINDKHTNSVIATNNINVPYVVMCNTTGEILLITNDNVIRIIKDFPTHLTINTILTHESLKHIKDLIDNTIRTIFIKPLVSSDTKFDELTYDKTMPIKGDMFWDIKILENGKFQLTSLLENRTILLSPSFIAIKMALHINEGSSELFINWLSTKTEDEIKEINSYGVITRDGESVCVETGNQEKPYVLYLASTKILKVVSKYVADMVTKEHSKLAHLPTVLLNLNNEGIKRYLV